MTRHLFVYGTLMRRAAAAGMGGPERQRLWQESQLIGPAVASARLYDFGTYPGVVLAPADSGFEVHGEVLRLSDPDATFAWLDAYEMIVPGQEALSEYARIVTTVDLATPGGGASTGRVESWIYVTQADVSALTHVPSGRWM